MFTKAITRKLCTRFSEGITTASLGKPDFETALRQHHGYILTMKSCGVDVDILEADEQHPDSCFVEDTAVIFDEAAVITNPGAASRKGEIHAMIPELKKHRELYFIQPPGTLEGGDVMQVNRHFYIGISERTNENGAHQLGSVLSKFAYSFSIIPVTSAPHLKSVMNYIGNNHLLASREFASHPAFAKFNVIVVPGNELYAANCLPVNGKLIVPKGFKQVKSELLKLNNDLIELDMSEFEKMDGGLTCLSLRFS